MNVSKIIVTEEDINLLIDTLTNVKILQINPRLSMEQILLRIMNINICRKKLNYDCYITSPQDSLCSKQEVRPISCDRAKIFTPPIQYLKNQINFIPKTRLRTAITKERRNTRKKYDWGRDYNEKNIPKLTQNAENLGNVLGNVMRKSIGSGEELKKYFLSVNKIK